MSKKKSIYNEIEKECLALLDWMLQKMKAMEEEGDDIGANGKKLSALFLANKVRIEARAQKRVREAEELKRIDLTDTDRGLLKESIEAGKKTDEKLLEIREALLREKFKMLNWGSKSDKR